MCVYCLFLKSSTGHRGKSGESPGEVKGKRRLFVFYVAVGTVLFIIRCESERDGGDMAIKYHAERDRT